MALNVSQLFDGQLEESSLQRVLHETAADAGSRDRFTLYGLIGDSLRGNSTPDDGFTLRILQRIKREQATPDPGYDPLADK